MVVVIGGYGGFGARLCRRLSAAGHHLLVAGRSVEKAADFCAELENARPLAMDRQGDVAAVLAPHRLDLVIDAAGPFQGSDHRVPRACIDLGIPYLDLADARDFVAGISALDGRARAAGVAIVSGASSLPALSGAVARRLALGLARVHSIDIALSASNRGSGGASVVKAALSYAGQPIRLWRGRRWIHAHGWQEMRREPFLFSDGTGLHGRLVGIAEVPDLERLPELLPGRPSTTFRAGTELAFQMRALWLASWIVRWKWLESLRPAARWLLPLYRLTLGLGGGRSAMKVTLKGATVDGLVERLWTLVADRDHGLEVPTLAAAILAEDVLAGRLPPGARDASSLLTLDRFEPAFAKLAVRHEIAERALAPPLYARVMGPVFERLPPMVRACHRVCGDAGAEGEGRVTRGTNGLARLVAAAMRFRPSGIVPLHVAFAEQDGVERWTRDFGGHCFSSELSESDGLVVERFGPLRFAFALPGGPDGLEMKLRRWSLFRLRLPLALAPRIAAREWEDGGRFRFDVRVAMPMIGEIVHYSGWLRPAGEPQPSHLAASGYGIEEAAA
jgi:NAD(P)-dependent dehydrogenase (short-subunit alcohol dehydrogenase family)